MALFLFAACEYITPSVSKYMFKSTTSHMPMHNFDR